MATSPNAPDSGVVRVHSLGRGRIVTLIGLLAFLALCLALSWITRGAMENLSFIRQQSGASDGKQSSVDLRPWQTAQTLAALAVTSEEHEYAREAERLADHEVDQAFAAALRMAGLEARRRTLTGEALALSQKITQLQQLTVQDQAQVDHLKAAGAGAQKGAAKPTIGADDLEVAQAQLGLDSDELTDAQRDLERASGNDSARIQSELAAHEAAMRKYDNGQEDDGQIAVLSVARHGTLAGRVKAWFNQRNRYALIEQALQDAGDDARSLTAQHNALEAQANAGAIKSGATTLASLQDRGTERQILSIDDDRIQADQQLASVYGKWGAQVQLQHRIVLHLILQSLAVIAFILLVMLVCDALVRRLMVHPALDRRQRETMRTILEVGIQVVGVLLILLVVFGPPQQTTTILGLATAALTIALQDYILAFLGWFKLIGKNGIRVGDWVEINGVGGEVTSIGLINTTLLETGSLAEKGLPTGRRISFINSFAIRGQYFNFSTEGQWLWDEVTASVPSSLDVQAVAERIERAVRDETEENVRIAEQEWQHGAHGTGLSRLSAAPSVHLRPAASGIDIHVRYVARASERVAVRNRLYQLMIELLHKQESLEQPVQA